MRIEDKIKKMTNLEMLTFMKKVNDTYAKENPNAPHILAEGTEKLIEDVLKEAEAHGNDPEIANVILKRHLESGKTINLN